MVEALAGVLTPAQDMRRRTIAQELGDLLSTEDFLKRYPNPVPDSRSLIENLPSEDVHRIKAAAGIRSSRVW